MSLKLKHLGLICNTSELLALPPGKLLINTINAHSYNCAQKDAVFAEALMRGDALIPDGISIVKACSILHADSRPTERIAGWDLFSLEMHRLNEQGGRVLFLGSSEHVLQKITARCLQDYPHLTICTYSPPYKAEFSEDDNRKMVDVINETNPDLLWIGMTAPKQEKWAYEHWTELNIKCHVGTIGAVFDFYAGTIKRAPKCWQSHGLEWLYRLGTEPRRMWKRYVLGNIEFIWRIALECIG